MSQGQDKNHVGAYELGRMRGKCLFYSVKFTVKLLNCFLDMI